MDGSRADTDRDTYRRCSNCNGTAPDARAQRHRISSPEVSDRQSDEAVVDDTGACAIGGEQRTVANEIHHARRAAAAAVNARYSCPRERHAAGKPGCAQSMLDVAECLISRERLELAANADALVQLPQLAAPQAVRELRLAGEHDLEQFAARCLARREQMFD